MNASQSRSIEPALFILRAGLGIFLLLWGIDKIVEPGATVKIFDHFYFLPIGPGAARVIGAVEVVFALAFLAGYRKTLTYGAAFAMHAISTVSTYKQLLSPFGHNHLFVAALPVLAGFAALWIARDQDRRFILGGARTGVRG
ncbi:MAG: DoxX family membrane protein [Deltaproteobacteria bacterium]|nr:DoxX family membrane protein [Deltaproteobacteria bacterium]